MSTKENQLVCYGLTPKILEPIHPIIGPDKIEFRPLTTESIFSSSQKPHPRLILCGTPKEISIFEAAQLLRLQFQKAEIFFIDLETSIHTVAQLKNNGFNEIFLIPEQWEFFQSSLRESVVRHALDSGTYQSINLLQIPANTVLDFDTLVYLPTNQRYVKLSLAGDVLDQKRIDRLFSKKYENVFVSLDQLPNFYQYTANKLRDLDPEITGNSEALLAAIQSTLGAIVNSASKDKKEYLKLMQDNHETLRNFFRLSGDNNWYSELLRKLDLNRDALRTHLLNVSTFAAFFSLGTKIGNPEELFKAGLIHDLGVRDLPVEIQKMPVQGMHKYDFDIYQTHIELALKDLKDRNIEVSENVQTLIRQHHELYNGRGYPKGLRKDKISLDSQILAIADRLEDWISIESKGASLYAINAYFNNKIDGTETQQEYNPIVMKKILELFPET